MQGPSYGRPLQLSLAGDGEERGDENNIDNNKATKRMQPQRTSSFYPGRGNSVISDVPTHIHSKNEGLNDDDYGDTDVEEEEEWLSVPQPLEPESATRNTRAPHVLGIERPVWNDNVNSASVKPNNAEHDNMPQEHPAIAHDLGLVKWPTETDLIFPHGSNKVMLTSQCPVVRAVIQDAIERTRASLMFSTAFPDLFEILDHIGEALVLAAEHNEATDIGRRLVHDHMYNINMTRIPRARIPLFRREVKDCCAAIVQAEFLAIPSPLKVMSLVEKQLSNYNYSFPRAGNGDPFNFLPMRTRPYRNIRIVNVIRDMFFTGGASSFAHRFRSQFSIHQGRDGVVLRELPIAMVALVATALYAAIKEWSTGTHKFMEFSSNAFQDVYNGHVNTFRHILENREDAYHLMMSDLYSQAISARIGFSAAIANIELDDIEG